MVVGRKKGTSRFFLFPGQKGGSLPPQHLVPAYELASHQSPRLFLARRLPPRWGCKAKAHFMFPLCSTSPPAHSLKDCVGLLGEKIWQPVSELSPLVPVCTTDANSCPEALGTLSCEVCLSQNRLCLEPAGQWPESFILFPVFHNSFPL